jgi:hypothetical protein
MGLAALVMAALGLGVTVRPAAAQFGGYYYWYTFPSPSNAGPLVAMNPSASPLNPWVVDRSLRGIARWDGSAWQYLSGPGGSIQDIAIDTNDQPWVVTETRAIYRRLTNGQWQQVPGASEFSISTGADGSVWVLGTYDVGGGNRLIYRWTGSGWQAIGGGGWQIAAGPNGTLWALKTDQSIWRMSADGVWSRMPGQADALAVAGDGTAWVVGPDNDTAGNAPIYKWSGSGWVAISGTGYLIAAGGISDDPVVSVAGSSGFQIKQRRWRRY